MECREDVDIEFNIASLLSRRRKFNVNETESPYKRLLRVADNTGAVNILRYSLRGTRRTYFAHNTENNPRIVTAELGCPGSINPSGKGRKQAKKIRGFLIH